MQKLWAILLLFALSLQCFSRLGILIHFEINRDYIARVLCVNRDKPEMHCDGKCYLRKKLRQNEQHKEHNNELAGNKMDLALFCPTELHFNRYNQHKGKHLYPPIVIAAYQSPFFDILRPPC